MSEARPKVAKANRDETINRFTGLLIDGLRTCTEDVIGLCALGLNRDNVLLLIDQMMHPTSVLSAPVADHDGGAHGNRGAGLAACPGSEST